MALEPIIPGSVLTATVAALVSLGTWFLVNFFAKPIVQIREKRFEALRVAEMYALTQPAMSQEGVERVVSAKRALLDIAVELRTHARGDAWPVLLYCWFAGYNLEEAVLALSGLRVMAGSPEFNDSTRMNNLNLVYLSLNARRHLSGDQIAELRKMIAEHHKLTPTEA